jgi:hypothetical protein
VRRALRVHSEQKKNACGEGYVYLSVHLSVSIFRIPNLSIEFVYIWYVRYATGEQSIFAVSNFLRSVRSMWPEILANEKGRTLMLLPKYSDRGNHRKHISHRNTRKHGNDINN